MTRTETERSMTRRQGVSDRDVSRAVDDRHAESGSQPLMHARTRCPRCETVLNVPPGAEGKKLKCPRCTTTFRVGDLGAIPRSSQPGVDMARPSSSPSTNEVPKRPSPSKTDLPRRPPTSADEPDLPVISGDLRDQFSLPLLEEDDDRPKPPKPKPRPRPSSGAIPTAGAKAPSSGVIPTVPSGPSAYAEADAAALIEDDEPIRPRRKTGAEARFTNRRCGCGGVVPAGMSICPRCGLDLETGVRDTSFDLLDEAPPLPPPSAPFGVMVVSLTSAIVGAGLAVASIALYVFQAEAPFRWGFLLLAAVSAFGVFAAVRLMRNRSPRFLLTALMLGALINVAALIVLPITIASTTVPIAERVPGSSPDNVPVDMILHPRIIPLTERIEWEKVNTGLAILGVTIIIAIYLTSPEVRRYSQRR